MRHLTAVSLHLVRFGEPIGVEKMGRIRERIHPGLKHEEGLQSAADQARLLPAFAHGPLFGRLALGDPAPRNLSGDVMNQQPILADEKDAPPPDHDDPGARTVVGDEIFFLERAKVGPGPKNFQIGILVNDFSGTHCRKLHRNLTSSFSSSSRIFIFIAHRTIHTAPETGPAYSAMNQ
jgi:hypothetical protein